MEYLANQTQKRRTTTKKESSNYVQSFGDFDDSFKMEETKQSALQIDL